MSILHIEPKDDSPLEIVKYYASRHPDDEFTFYEYTYDPDYGDVDNNEFYFTGEDILNGKLDEFFKNAKDNNAEIALSSRVYINTHNSEPVTKHIPMIDFKAPSSDLLPVSENDFYNIVGSPTNFKWFNSGKSYHAYGMYGLLTEDGWLDFLGNCLLLNPNDAPPIVDVRWIGRRIISRDCALRLTANSALHTHVPKNLKTLPFNNNAKRIKRVY